MDIGAVPPIGLINVFAVGDRSNPGVSPIFPSILPLCIRATTIYIRRFRPHPAIVRQWVSPGRERTLLNSDGQTMIGRELYSIKEARELLGGISRNSIYELLRSGNLLSVVLGCRRFIAATGVPRVSWRPYNDQKVRPENGKWPSRHAVHSLAVQIVKRTIPKTVTTWPQRIFVAGTSISPFGGEIGIEICRMQVLSVSLGSQAKRRGEKLE